MSDTPNIWLESMWITHKETATIKDKDGNPITREYSVGMTAKSDGSAYPQYLYDNIKSALSSIEEEEKEIWLNRQKMLEEQKRTEDNLKEGTDGEDRPE